MIKKKDTDYTAHGSQQISRKEAIYKATKYAAFTAAAMMSILEPVHAGIPPKSPPKPPGAQSQQKKARKPKRTDPPPVY